MLRLHFLTPHLSMAPEAVYDVTAQEYENVHIYIY